MAPRRPSDTVRLMSRSRDALVRLARAVAEAAPVSMGEVADLEQDLVGSDHGLPGYDEFATAVAMFRPGGGDHLLDEAQLSAAARELLHELRDHELCFHDVPLNQRP
jgi:hypothetical protein